MHLQKQTSVFSKLRQKSSLTKLTFFYVRTAVFGIALNEVTEHTKN